MKKLITILLSLTFVFSLNAERIRTGQSVIGTGDARYLKLDGTNAPSAAYSWTTALTTTDTIQAEQLTSTDDITMQGHLFTMGDVAAATDTVLSFLGSTNSGDITFDESADEFDFGGSIISTLGSGSFQTGITDGTTVIQFGNYSWVGNITGTDVDISAGTGDFSTTGTISDGVATLSDGELLDLVTIEATTTLNFEIGDVAQLTLTDGVLAPTTDEDINLGSTTKQYNNIYIAGVVDFGTNTIGDGGMTGNWAMNSSDITSVGSMAGSDLDISAGTGDYTSTGAMTTGSLNVDSGTLVANLAGYEDKVGIGTTTPSVALDVVGAITASTTITGEQLTSTDDATITDDIAVNSISSQDNGAIDVLLGSDAGDDFIIDTTGVIYEGDNNFLGVGINPASQFHVYGGAATPLGVTFQADTNQSVLLGFQSDRSWLIANDGGAGLGTADYFHIYDVTGGASRLVIDTSGNVGIGTTAPVCPLHIDADAVATYGTFSLQDPDTGNTATPYISFVDDTPTRLGWFGFGSSSTDDMTWATNTGNIIIDSDEYTVLDGGFTGAVTGAPDQWIWSISGRYPTWGLYYNEGSPDVLNFNASGVIQHSFVFGGTGTTLINANHTAGSDLNVSAGVLYVEGDDRQVGINIASPTGAIHVYDATDPVKILIESDAASGNTFPVLQLRNNEDYEGNLVIYNSSYTANIFGTSRANQVVLLADEKGLMAGTIAAEPIILGTANAERMRILGTGNVGIGEVAPQDTLEVNGTGLFKDKLKFTQDDGNEYIDSLNDGYMDYGATTGHRFDSDIFLLTDNRLISFGTDGVADSYITFGGTDLEILSAGGLDIDVTTDVDINLSLSVGADLSAIGTSTFGAGANQIEIDGDGDLTFSGTAGFYPRRLSQNAEPINGTGNDQIDAGEILIWHDADGVQTWLTYNDATDGIVKVLLE